MVRDVEIISVIPVSLESQVIMLESLIVVFQTPVIVLTKRMIACTGNFDEF